MTIKIKLLSSKQIQRLSDHELKRRRVISTLAREICEVQKNENKEQAFDLEVAVLTYELNQRQRKEVRV